MKKLTIIILSLFMLIGIASLVPATVTLASAADQIKTGVDSVGGGDSSSLPSTFKTIVNVMLFILGAIAVIMVVVGGIRYTTSGGDSSSTKAAKDTILYAVVGLVVAMLAYAIVNFVLTSFK